MEVRLWGLASCKPFILPSTWGGPKRLEGQAGAAEDDGGERAADDVDEESEVAGAGLSPVRRSSSPILNSKSAGAHLGRRASVP